MPLTQNTKRGIVSCLFWSVIIFSVIAHQTAWAQVNSIADGLQGLRPNLLANDKLNCRAIDATRLSCVRPCDQVWLVSTRSIPEFSLDACDLNAIQLLDGCWHESNIQSFQAEHNENLKLQSVVYVHGNMTDLNWSIIRGLKVYENLIGNRQDSPPVRFVIWSWPSERQTVPIRDALLKSRKAVCVGYTLRAFLDTLQGTAPALIGYSFGGQVVVSALQSPYHEDGKGPYHVSLIAPALDRDFIHCEIDSCKVVSNTAIIEAYVDSKDRVIRAHGQLCRKKYRRSGKCDHLVSSKLNGCCEILSEIDITDCQPKHSITLYSQDPSIIEGFNRQLVRITRSRSEPVLSPTPIAPTQLQHPVAPTESRLDIGILEN